ncbi:hypothetical protein FD755_012924, partial [Muntiacus reevesi]
DKYKIYKNINPNLVLDKINITDTPGILSGEKQSIKWFAEWVDPIVLLFDHHKFDVSKEFSEVIKALKNHKDKTRVVVRVFLGSFWPHPFLIPDNHKLFKAEEQDLFKDIQYLPPKAAVRKLTDLIKRPWLAAVHAYLISSLKKEMPNVFGKESKKKQLMNNFSEICQKIEKSIRFLPCPRRHSLHKMQQLLETQSFSNTWLMATVHQEGSLMPAQAVKGGTFPSTMNRPFGDKPTYEEIFHTLYPVSAKKEMVRSQLPHTVLGKIWKPANEFTLDNHLIKAKLVGRELSPHLILPPKWRYE